LKRSGKKKETTEEKIAIAGINSGKTLTNLQ
jgi:hypothetical protein